MADSLFDQALKLEGITGAKADFARSIYQQESSSGKNAKTSNAGAAGVMQIIPSTFASVADKGWDINNTLQNARAGIRYATKMFNKADGDPAIAAAGYYGGPGALIKAKKGIAVSDPRNPNAPTTLEYGQQVAGRMVAPDPYLDDFMSRLKGTVASNKQKKIDAQKQAENIASEDDLSSFMQNIAPKPAVTPKPPSDTLLGDVGQGFKNLGGAIVGDGGFVDVFTAPTRTGFGAAEAVVGGLAGMGKEAVKGLYGTAGGIAGMLPQAIGGGGGFERGYEQGAQSIENLIPSVRMATKAGSAIQEIMGAPAAEFRRGGQAVGQSVEGLTGSATLGGAAASGFETLGNAIAIVAPLRGRVAPEIAAAERTRQQIIDSQPARQPAPTPTPIPEPAPVRTPAERMDADIAAFQAERAAQQPLAGTPEGLAAQADAMNAPLPPPPPAIPEGYSLVDLGDGVMGVRRNPEPAPPPRPVIDEIATPIPEITRPDGKTYVLDDSLDLVHGSSKPDLSIDTLQITGRTDAKQSKRGRSFGGFYLTSKADEAQATGYANMGDGTPTLYDVRIKPDTKILEKTGDIMRLDDNYINQLVNDGYGLIVGKDVRGRTEYVVLDKNAVEGMAARSESTPAPLPVPPTPRPTPVPPVPPIPESAPIPAPRPIPEVIPDGSVADIAGLPLQQLASAARTSTEGVVGKKTAQELLAEQAAPSKPVVEAATRLGIIDSLQPDHVTTNQSFRELSQAIKSYTGSPLRAAELEGLSQVATRADKIIAEIGADKDVSSMSQKIKTEMQAAVDELSARANPMYEALKTKVPANTQVKAPSVLSFIDERIANLGGKEYLSPLEKTIYARLSDKTSPTYARLDDIRRELTAARYKKEGVFKDADSGLIKKLETELKKDQQAALAEIAPKIGMTPEALLSDFKLANDTVSMRKSIEEHMVNLFGKQLDGNIARSLKNAVNGLPIGDTKAFVSIIKSIPESMRSEAVANGLAYAFDKNLGAINHNTFANFWNGIKRQGEANKLLKQYLPEESYKALNDLGIVSESISKASKERIVTGRLNVVNETLKEADTWVGKLYEKAKAGAGAAIGAEAISASAGLPGVGIAAGAIMAVLKDKPPIHLAVDRVLGSKEFRDAVATKSGMEALRGQQ